MSVKTLTQREFAGVVADLRNFIHRDPEGRKNIADICGGEQVLDAILSPRGLGIGRFAALMDLPASTIRHFLREDLLHPYTVNSKFKFLLHNVIEVRGIRQWQSLGLTLEETRAFLEAQQLAGMLIQSDGGKIATVIMGLEQPTPEGVRDLRMSTLVRIREANARLTEKYEALGGQLEAARALEKSLSELTLDGVAVTAE